MNRTILQYNGDLNRNTAFLSEKTQNAILDACEAAKRFGAEFEYKIRNDYNSNGVFEYTVNGEKKKLHYSPISQSQSDFLNEVKGALFDILTGKTQRTIYIIKNEFLSGCVEETSALAYATRKAAEHMIKTIIESEVNCQIAHGVLVERNGEIEFDYMDSTCEVQISPTALYLDDGVSFHDAIWIEEQELFTEAE